MPKDEPFFGIARLDCLVDSLTRILVLEETESPTSESVFKSVNGMRRKPTPVLAVLPTIKSPAVVSFTFLAPLKDV